MSADFFDDAEIQRDSASGRPLIRPIGAPDHLRVPYTRASSLAGYITDDRHIHKWEMRYLAKAMGRHEDLAALAAVERYSTGFDAVNLGREKSASGRRLDAIIERAMDRERIHEKADYGTAVHASTEPGAPYTATRMAADVASFWACLKEYGIRLLGTEVFTACDATQSAGTFDHLAYVPGLGVCITDKKTGRMNPHEFGVQLSTYANGDVYDVETHERRSLEEFAGSPINRDVGVVFAIKDGKTQALEIDLEHGWRGAQAAAAARDYVESDMTLASVSKRAVNDERRELVARLAVATREEEMLDLWREHKHLWNDDLTLAATDRKKALS